MQFRFILMRLLLRIGKDLHVRSAKAGVNGSSFIPTLALVVMRSKYISISGSPIGYAGKRG